MADVWGRAVAAVLVAVIAAVGASVLFGSAGIAQLLALRADRQALGEAAVAQLQANDTLRDALGRLDRDARHLEAIARGPLGLVRPNELVYRFRTDEPASAP